MENEEPLMLYYLRLENQKLFLFAIPISNDYDVESIDDETIMLQCQLSFNFVTNNPPIEIVHKVEVNDFCEVDCYVKKNMKFHGIEKVRGGTYSMDLIPDNLIEGLKLELFDSNCRLAEQKIVTNLIQKCKNNIDNKTKNYEAVSIQGIKNKIAEYKEILAKRRQLSKGIDRTFIEDLEWIRNYLPIRHEKISNDNRKKYKDILLKMKTLYVSFCEHRDSFQGIPHLKYPEFVLDNLFFHSRTLMTNNNQKQKFEIDKETLLSHYEHMAYWIINRCEEYDYDLSTI
jgi:hypothetical protein